MNVKEIGKNVVGRTAKNPVAWSVYRLCGRLSTQFGRIYGHAHHTLEIGERNEKMRRLTLEMFADRTVANGPFRGMSYASAQPFGSTLLPKLLGSYESELHPFLNELFAKDYASIVDVGCGEGYYAVGLALRFVNSEVYAFDTNSHARNFCAKMAKLNGVERRVHVGEFCDQAALRSIPLGGRSLIVSDCEGYESVLFNQDMAYFLATHDLIVEVHDFIEIDISRKIREAFQETHQIRSIKSIDDIEKAHTYQYPQLAGYDSKTRHLIVGERRPAIMEWLVMTPKQVEKSPLQH